MMHLDDFQKKTSYKYSSNHMDAKDIASIVEHSFDDHDRDDTYTVNSW